MEQALVRKLHVSDDETSISDLRDLRAFCLTVDLRSLTAVARLTGESKPTISRRIARVEQALGIRLLHRNPRRVEPTEEGALYRQRLAQVLELLDDANATIRRSDVAPSGRLRVTAPPEFGPLLAPLFVDFGERFPNVTVEALMSQRLLDLDADHIDVALRFSFGLADSSLVAHRLLDLDVAFVASPTYLRRRGPAPTELDELSQHRVLMLTQVRPSARAVPQTSKGWRAFKALTASLQPSLISSDMNFIRELALAGGGSHSCRACASQRICSAASSFACSKSPSECRPRRFISCTRIRACSRPKCARSALTCSRRSASRGGISPQEQRARPKHKCAATQGHRRQKR